MAAPVVLIVSMDIPFFTRSQRRRLLHNTVLIRRPIFTSFITVKQVAARTTRSKTIKQIAGWGLPVVLLRTVDGVSRALTQRWVWRT
jgi:hypothetical protein